MYRYRVHLYKGRDVIVDAHGFSIGYPNASLGFHIDTTKRGESEQVTVARFAPGAWAFLENLGEFKQEA